MQFRRCWGANFESIPRSQSKSSVREGVRLLQPAVPMRVLGCTRSTPLIRSQLKTMLLPEVAMRNEDIFRTDLSKR